MEATWYEILVWTLVPTFIGLLASQIDVLGAIKDHFHFKPKAGV